MPKAPKPLYTKSSVSNVDNYAVNVGGVYHSVKLFLYCGQIGLRSGGKVEQRKRLDSSLRWNDRAGALLRGKVEVWKRGGVLRSESWLVVQHSHATML